MFPSSFEYVAAASVGEAVAALAAGGEAGVKRVLDILRDELTNTMIASGCATVEDIRSSLLRM